MTLSFSKLNEIAYLYENAVHGEQEVLCEDASDAGVSARKTIGKAAGSYFNAVKGVAKGYADVAGSQLKGLAGQTTTSNNPLARAGNAVTRTISAPSRAGLSFAKGLVTGQGSDKPAASTNTPSKFARPQNAAPGLADIRGARPGSGRLDDPIAGKGPKGNEVGSTPPKPPVSTDASAGSGGAGRGGTGTRPPGDNGPKVIPTKPAGSAMDQWAKANPKLAAASAERDRTRGTSATTNPLMKDMKSSLPAPADKPEATPSLGQRAAAMPAMGSSQFKPATTSQATNAAGSNSAAASGSVVPQNDKLAASKKPVDIKASYEYDAYDLVLEYLLSQGHAETVAEAQYIMTEMDAEMIGDIVEEVLEEGDNYDKNRKRAAQRAAARNEARAKGQTGNVPGVGYVTPGTESETYRDSAGTERHKTGARMPEKKG